MIQLRKVSWLDKRTTKSKLSNKGYVIIKKHYSESQLKNIRKELNVTPFSAYRSKFAPPPSFPVYLEYSAYQPFFSV